MKNYIQLFIYNFPHVTSYLLTLDIYDEKANFIKLYNNRNNTEDANEDTYLIEFQINFGKYTRVIIELFENIEEQYNYNNELYDELHYLDNMFNLLEDEEMDIELC
jgi:hypothetical protein